MPPIPNLDNKVFETARKFEEVGINPKLYTWNFEGQYKDIALMWKGANPTEGQPPEAVEGTPYPIIIKGLKLSLEV
ncbi:hypothetical protein ACFOU2_20705 [Bacillus songklensis]|uniref:Uncharacterized protein n=1 Tax=Bacillus songklensis TaxID=1069116 RepID=A0ABV8B635_9BACI